MKQNIMNGSFTKHNRLNIYFGNRYDKIQKTNGTYGLAPFEKLVHTFNLTGITCLAQTHGTEIYHMQHNGNSLFEHNGDGLLTNNAMIGIGVVTADCLPVILYNNKTNAIGIAHAGWRGALAGILHKLVFKMTEKYNSQPSDLCAYLGPAARNCCYQVGEDFIKAFSNPKASLTIPSGKFYFDLPTHATMQLTNAGLTPASINKEFCICTICNHEFSSHRREGTDSGRQLTIAWLI